MRKFLGINLIKRPHVAAMVNICCLAASSLLVASTAQAMPQKTPKDVLNAVFTKPSNSNITRLTGTGPSPSCFRRTACVADKNFQEEFKNFVNFIHTRYPSAHDVPSADQLQQHACNRLSAGDSNTREDHDPVSMGQWLASFLSYDYWSTQAGTNPYQTSPVWWCYLDASTQYYLTASETFTGADQIINQFTGLGKPYDPNNPTQGQGFYVAQASVTDVYPAISLDSGFFDVQTYTNKELVSINITQPGKVKPVAQYQMFMKLQKHNTYPLETIAFMQETVDKLATILWLGYTVTPPSAA